MLNFGSILKPNECSPKFHEVTWFHEITALNHNLFVDEDVLLMSPAKRGG